VIRLRALCRHRTQSWLCERGRRALQFKGRLDSGLQGGLLFGESGVFFSTPATQSILLLLLHVFIGIVSQTSEVGLVLASWYLAHCLNGGRIPPSLPHCPALVPTNFESYRKSATMLGQQNNALLVLWVSACNRGSLVVQE
jgi:hypothetical protein